MSNVTTIGGTFDMVSSFNQPLQLEREQCHGHVQSVCGDFVVQPAAGPWECRWRHEHVQHVFGPSVIQSTTEPLECESRHDHVLHVL